MNGAASGAMMANRPSKLKKPWFAPATGNARGIAKVKTEKLPESELLRPHDADLLFKGYKNYEIVTVSLAVRKCYAHRLSVSPGMHS